MYGAITLQIRGNFDEGMELVKQVAAHAPVTIVNSINPYRLQGQKTAAFEIVEELGFAPDFHCPPVGNAIAISLKRKQECCIRPFGIDQLFMRTRHSEAKLCQPFPVKQLARIFLTRWGDIAVPDNIARVDSIGAHKFGDQ